MWNLLVVEDEAIVRLGLRYMINWEENGIRWKAEASNGEEALRIVETEDIHIVLTDIRMPGMDGLELAHQIRRRNELTQIIFLSSYDNFPYVKEALRLGAVDYLHKPTMDEREMTATLRKAVARLEKTVKAQHSNLSEAARNEYLLSLLDPYTFPQRILLSELEETCRGGVWLTAFRIREDAGHHEEDNRMKFLSVRYVIEEYVSRDWGGIVFHRHHREILWLAPAAAKAAQGTTERERYLERLRRKVFELLNVAVVFSFSSVYEKLEQIPDAYMEVQLTFPVHEQCNCIHVRMAKEYVDKHLFEDISLTKVAEVISISPGYLSRIFLKEVGESFSDYVIRNKIAHARKLLRETNMKVYEISEALGYTNPHHFSKLFKEWVGMTPLEYRNK